MPAVYGTPRMILHMETATGSADQLLLPAGHVSVGMTVNIRHLAATSISRRARASRGSSRSRARASSSSWRREGGVVRFDKNPAGKQKTDFPRCGTPSASCIGHPGSGISFILSEYLLDSFNLLARLRVAHEREMSAVARRIAMICRASWLDQLRYPSCRSTVGAGLGRPTAWMAHPRQDPSDGGFTGCLFRWTAARIAFPPK